MPLGKKVNQENTCSYSMITKNFYDNNLDSHISFLKEQIRLTHLYKIYKLCVNQVTKQQYSILDCMLFFKNFVDGSMICKLVIFKMLMKMVILELYGCQKVNHWGTGWETPKKSPSRVLWSIKNVSESHAQCHGFIWTLPSVGDKVLYSEP